jgi:putative sterol carrier protein
MSTTPRDPRAQLVDAIGRLTDDQVLGLMNSVGVDTAIQGVFLEMQRRFLPDRTAGKRVEIEWDLSTPDGQVTYQMAVSADGLTWATGSAPAPSLTVSCVVTDFMRLMIGQLDSTEAFMTGRLRVAGDLQVVQELGTWFDLG